jgi:hypothetical protein
MPFGRNVVISTDNVVINVVISDRIWELLIGSTKDLRSQFVTLKRGLNIKYSPYAFTEQGVAMLSSILRSKRAIQVNIEIMRAVVKLRQILAAHVELARKLETLERRYHSQFNFVFEAIRQLMAPKEAPNKALEFN